MAPILCAKCITEPVVTQTETNDGADLVTGSKNNKENGNGFHLMEITITVDIWEQGEIRNGFLASRLVIQIDSGFYLRLSAEAEISAQKQS